MKEPKYKFGQVVWGIKLSTVRKKNVYKGVYTPFEFPIRAIFADTPDSFTYSSARNPYGSCSEDILYATKEEAEKQAEIMQLQLDISDIETNINRIEGNIAWLAKKLKEGPAEIKEGYEQRKKLDKKLAKLKKKLKELGGEEDVH